MSRGRFNWLKNQANPFISEGKFCYLETEIARMISCFDKNDLISNQVKSLLIATDLFLQETTLEPIFKSGRAKKSDEELLGMLEKMSNAIITAQEKLDENNAGVKWGILSDAINYSFECIALRMQALHESGDKIDSLVHQHTNKLTELLNQRTHQNKMKNHFG